MYYRLSVIALALEISGVPIVVPILSVRIYLRLDMMIRRSRRLSVVAEMIDIAVKRVGIEWSRMAKLKILGWLRLSVLDQVFACNSVCV